MTTKDKLRELDFLARRFKGKLVKLKDAGEMLDNASRTINVMYSVMLTWIIASFVWIMVFNSKFKPDVFKVILPSSQGMTIMIAPAAVLLLAMIFVGVNSHRKFKKVMRELDGGD
jgi:hypothetical protein